jgi:hypothetical protein
MISFIDVVLFFIGFLLMFVEFPDLEGNDTE